jgi:hypothetical protein
MSKNVGFSEEQQPDLSGQLPAATGPFRWLEKAELEAISRKADMWLEANRALVDALATGTYVLIDVDTGGHATEKNYEQARAEFDRLCGASTYAFVHRVGNPYRVGGGWWALHSGA